MDRGSRGLLVEATMRFLAAGTQDRSTYDTPPQDIDLHPEQPLRSTLAGSDTAMQAPPPRLHEMIQSKNRCRNARHTAGGSASS